MAQGVTMLPEDQLKAGLHVRAGRECLRGAIPELCVPKVVVWFAQTQGFVCGRHTGCRWGKGSSPSYENNLNILAVLLRFAGLSHLLPGGLISPTLARHTHGAHSHEIKHTGCERG